MRNVVMRSAYYLEYNYYPKKIKQDLHHIGNECKKRGMKTADYLELVVQYWERADKRLHHCQWVNPETLLLEFYTGNQLEEIL